MSHVAVSSDTKTLDFIKAAKAVHGEKFDYSNTVFTCASYKVKIICKECKSEFEQVASIHLKGSGCLKCHHEKKVYSLQTFLEKAKKVHGDKFDYSKVIYVRSNVKVTITCKACKKDFEQIPKSHLSGVGCSHCMRNKKLTQQEFVKRAQAAHGDKYDYSKTVFERVLGEVQILCNTCKNTFTQVAQRHLNGGCCPICEPSKASLRKTEGFINRAVEVHGEKYDYSNTEFNHMHSPVTVRCKKCKKDFKIVARNHLKGQGCRGCV